MYHHVTNGLFFQGCDLLVFPEYGVGGDSKDCQAVATHISAIARDLKLHLVVNLLTELDGKIFNTAMAFGSNGSVVSTYRK